MSYGLEKGIRSNGKLTKRPLDVAMLEVVPRGPIPLELVDLLFFILFLYFFLT